MQVRVLLITVTGASWTKRNETIRLYKANVQNQGNQKISANQLVELIVDSNDFSRD